MARVKVINSKKWPKADKDKKLKDLKVPKKRKQAKDCTPEEHEMIYGYPDWNALKLEQDK